MAVTKRFLSLFQAHRTKKRFCLTRSCLLPPIHSQRKVKSKPQLVNNPCYSWICSCQRLSHLRQCMVEVQWKTGILFNGLSYRTDAVVRKSCEHCFDAPLHLQVKFVTPSCCLGRRPESQCPDFSQSCRDVVLNNIKSRVANSCCCSRLGIQHYQIWQCTPKHRSLVEKKTSITGRGSQCPDRVLKELLSFYFCPSLLKL